MILSDLQDKNHLRISNIRLIIIRLSFLHSSFKASLHLYEGTDHLLLLRLLVSCPRSELLGLLRLLCSALFFSSGSSFIWFICLLFELLSSSGNLLSSVCFPFVQVQISFVFPLPVTLLSLFRGSAFTVKSICFLSDLFFLFFPSSLNFSDYQTNLYNQRKNTRTCFQMTILVIKGKKTFQLNLVQLEK